MTISKRKITAQKNKEKIIKMTLQLLLKKGSSGAASTTDICAAAKLTRPTLYHYFGSKRGLLLAVHMEAMERDLKPYLEKAISINDPLERLNYMIRKFTNIICLRPELRILIHDTLTIRDKYFREVRGEWKRHYILLRNTIAQLKSERKIKTDLKPSWAALFVLGMVTWVTYWFDFSREENVDQIAESALRLVLNGLGCGESNTAR
jgi:AcrR family transcriptional regulator